MCILFYMYDSHDRWESSFCFQPQTKNYNDIKPLFVSLLDRLSYAQNQPFGKNCFRDTASYPECNTLKSPIREEKQLGFGSLPVRQTSKCVYLRFKEVSDCRPMMMSGMVLMQLWYRVKVSKATRWQTSEGMSASLFFERSAERRVQKRGGWVNKQSFLVFSPSTVKNYW